MNEKLTVASRRPNDVAATKVPSAFEEAFANDPVSLTDPTKEQNATPIQASAYSVISSSANYVQFGNTIRAYTDAGMTYQHIANAAVSLGERVETIKTNAAVATNMTTNSGQVIEEANKIRGFQNRGEEIILTPRLNYPASSSATNLVTTTQVINQNPEQRASVVEGIKVTQQTPASHFPSGNSNLRNGFIGPLSDSALADAKKAA